MAASPTTSGSELTLEATSLRTLQVVNPGDSYQCSSDPRAYFGLGERDRYDTIRVRWPDGLEERFPGGPADRAIVLRRGEGAPPLKRE